MLFTEDFNLGMSELNVPKKLAAVPRVYNLLYLNFICCE